MATGFIMLDAPNPTTAQGGYPRRGGFRPSGTCIVHTSEGAWQSGVDALTRLVQTRGDYGCYHQACDWVDIAHYYPWEWECWQDSETNNWAVGIAAACKTSDWAIMPAEIREGYYRNLARMAADFVTYMRETYGVVVPLRRLSGAEARARVPGFCAHGDSGVARSDPGRDFDWGLFFEYTRQALGGISPAGSITTEEDEVGVTERFEPDVRGALQNITDKINKLPSLDRDLRARLDILSGFERDVRADLANKGAELAALRAAVVALADKQDGVSTEAVLAAVQAGVEKFTESYRLTVQRVEDPAPAAEEVGDNGAA
ncbi:endolysin [Arthrobacter phage Cupello]|nr:endolysin [Arthrobacter phage Cupello]